MIYCMNCGAQLPDEANFCFSCGKPTVKRAESGAQEKLSSPKAENSLGRVAWSEGGVSFTPLRYARKHGRDEALLIFSVSNDSSDHIVPILYSLEKYDGSVTRADCLMEVIPRGEPLREGEYLSEIPAGQEREAVLRLEMTVAELKQKRQFRVCLGYCPRRPGYEEFYDYSHREVIGDWITLMF